MFNKLKISRYLKTPFSPPRPTEMPLKTLHAFSGLVLAAFVAVHLFNHAFSLLGAEAHIGLMNTLRVVYRHPVAEAVLMGAVLVQVGSGLRLVWAGRPRTGAGFGRLQRWSGLYLAGFFLIHLGAVWGGRLVLNLDTNFYFGVAGLNTFPFNLFFVPYYGLAVFSFFAHVAGAHRRRMRHVVLGLTPRQQAIGIVAFGVLVTFGLLFGLTNGFRGVAIPAEYGVLVGR